ncbi:hypothetical protein [cyanobacterium endosymbiont of Rhopalodia gibberula]|uniref:hypothetical protein n=1 Tax=cyanobacterium endosymbiont of Rhopalodia gibberula TaxID=1763363 RepID=UPI001E63B72F|nr:hypothetical protein [cyanobacterium endosymbiont of Rhopalodia gibberula]
MIKRRFSVSVRELGAVLCTHSGNFEATELTLVRPQKLTKLDLSNDYSCLCRQQYPLFPIVLTKSFVRDRCQQIFVFEENKQIIERLSLSCLYWRSWSYGNLDCSYGTISNVIGNNFFVSLSALMQTLWQ